MSPKTTSIWLPLTRLTAFFVAVVVVGSSFLQAIRPTIPRAVHEQVRPETLDQRKGNLKRKWKAVQGQFPSRSPAKELQPPPSTNPPSEGGRADSARPLMVSEPIWTPEARRPSVFDMRCPVCGESDGEISRTIGDSLSRVEFHRHSLYGDLPIAFCARPSWTWVEDVANAVFSTPEKALDGVADGLGTLAPQESGLWSDGEERTILDRFFQGIGYTESDGRPFSRLLENLYQYELRFFGRFQESYLYGFSVEDGDEAVSAGDFIAEQEKVLWSAVGKTYLERFRKPQERAQEQAFHFDRWQGLDFVVAPTVIAVTAYFRGFERRMSIGGTRLAVTLEPIRTILSHWGRADLEEFPVAIGVEWGPKDWLVKWIVTLGFYGGDAEVDFFGIGTGANEVKRLLTYLIER